MADKKHYIITSITLGLIGASSALLIGLTNMLTKEPIAANEKNKINAGIYEIFGKSSLVCEEFDYEADEHKYVKTCYVINNEHDEKQGLAFRTTGSNLYGKITLIIGFDEASHGYKGSYVVVDEQTYASTLEENYIDPLNSGDAVIDDVSCGATYGAKLMRDMVNEAQEAVKEIESV